MGDGFSDCQGPFQLQQFREFVFDFVSFLPEGSPGAGNTGKVFFAHFNLTFLEHNFYQKIVRPYCQSYVLKVFPSLFLISHLTSAVIGLHHS